MVIGFRRVAAVSTVAVCLAACLMVCLAGCAGKKPGETDVLNDAARLPQGLPVNPLSWRVVTTMVDRGKGTTATLTANDRAILYTGVGQYPAGSELALTTWGERDDPHWFGARIPGGFVRLEVVSVRAGADGKPVTGYQRFEGFEGGRAREVTGAAEDERRKSAILAMRAAEMP
jgi:hypothetical protein